MDSVCHGCRFGGGDDMDNLVLLTESINDRECLEITDVWCNICAVFLHCGCRFGGGDDVDDPAAEPVDALTMGRMMALVAQQGGDLDVALEQVGLWVFFP
jgi:hypothetical protein